MTDLTASVGSLAAAIADRYTIERELGQGGMATVYLALDIRHDRRVALKVLRPELAAILGGERFLKEIRLTANLQHPHILALHDSGEAGGLVYYVMPYVDGESLRDRLNREKQLPVEEAVRIAREVAGAIDYAHRHGVVHRDIKPENILMQEGQALVADFGIALAASRSDGGSRMTETGMSLGTPHYMAPEQAMGEREITPRADIYALGCVLYEMLAGEPPFTGPTAQAIVARVMTEQPRSLTLQRRTVPPHVEAAVGKALEKLPADRFHSAAEFALALGNATFTTASATVASAAGRRRGSRALVPLAALAVLLAAFAAWGWLRPKPVPAVRRYGLAFPQGQAPTPDRRFAISPDGSRLVYVGPAENGTQLWVKEASRYEATPLPGTIGVSNFTFSPDGQWIAYAQTGQLKKQQITGGAAMSLADSISGNVGLAWLGDGTIVYIASPGNQLRRVPGVGGPSTQVYRADSGGALRLPSPLPGNRGVIFTRCYGSGCRLRQDLLALDFGSGRAEVVVTGAAIGTYIASGQLLYTRRDGAMFAVPFDPRALKTTGAPVPVLDSISVLNEISPLIAISASGTMVMRPGSALSSQPRYFLAWVDRSGRSTPIDSSWLVRLTVAGGNAGWAVSPDGRAVAIGLNTDAGDDIWRKLLPDGPLSRVSFDSASDFRPRWSPDGQRITYISGGNVLGQLAQRRADATGAEERLTNFPGSLFEGAWTQDGKWIVARVGGTLGQVGNRDIVAMRVGVDSTPRPLLASPSFDEAAFAVSPDVKWIAYETNETGRSEVYVRPFPNTDSGKWQISSNGGVAPVWSRDGRELFYVNGSRDMVAVAIRSGATLGIGESRVLFHLGDDLYLQAGENYTPFDVARDGRFLMAQRYRSAAAQSAPLIIVENWFEEIRQRIGNR